MKALVHENAHSLADFAIRRAWFIDLDVSLGDLHFDTRQYAHLVWKDASDLYTQLKNRIGATIGDGPLPKT